MKPYDIEGEVTYGEAYERGWQDYLRVHRQSNPEPEKPGILAGWNEVIILFIVVVIASVLLASTRTFPAFANVVMESAGIAEKVANFEGFLGTLSVELFLVVSVMYLAINHPAKNIGYYIVAGFIFSFFVSVCGNMYTTTESIDMNDGARGIISLGVSGLIGLSAPVNAALGGYILGVMLEQTRGARQAIWNEYHDNRAAWLGACRIDFESKTNRTRYGLNAPKAAQLSAQPSESPSLLTQSSTQLSAQLSDTHSNGRSVEGYNGSASTQLLRWLDQNPDAIRQSDKDIQEAAARAGIRCSAGTVSNLMKPFRYFLKHGFEQNDESIAMLIDRKPEVVKTVRAVMEKHFESIGK